jgi:hypothetical protein
MKRSLELFGKALLDYYKGKEVTLRIRRDDGLIDEHDLSAYFKLPKEWPKPLDA